MINNNTFCSLHHNLIYTYVCTYMHYLMYENSYIYLLNFLTYFDLITVVDSPPCCFKVTSLFLWEILHSVPSRPTVLFSTLNVKPQSNQQYNPYGKVACDLHYLQHWLCDIPNGLCQVWCLHCVPTCCEAREHTIINIKSLDIMHAPNPMTG